ncbi:MAG TPA: HAMP domain-containing sensor histidine kinase, partial [Ruminococcus bromii]|nr:HAMP domain-containing sensor histidine kinase [Ruminococcus bromii]
IILTDFFCGGYANDGLIETAQDNNIVQTDMFTYIFCSQAKINGNISVIYAEQINVLDECYERILIMIIYICVLIIISAPFIWVISRRSVKYQIRLEHERRDYTNALAHDIKTPLFIIGGNAETLLEISQNQAQKECAQNVLDCSKSANRLVEDMLDFSAFDGDSYVLNRERINLNDLVSDLLKRYGASVTLEYNESIIINADRTLTERMLENLIDNAVKHTDDKNGIKITLHKNRFIIENHCKNLNEKDLCRIFEPYQTLSNSGGNGLGLSIVKTICNLHNFKCSVSLENYVIKFIVNF